MRLRRTSTPEACKPPLMGPFSACFVDKDLSASGYFIRLRQTPTYHLQNMLNISENDTINVQRYDIEVC